MPDLGIDNVNAIDTGAPLDFTFLDRTGNPDPNDDVSATDSSADGSTNTANSNNYTVGTTMSITINQSGSYTNIPGTVGVTPPEATETISMDTT